MNPIHDKHAAARAASAIPRSSGRAPAPLKAGTAEKAMRAVDAIEGYHAHVYYEPPTRALAQTLRDAIGNQFSVTLGRWHDRPVGPHPQSMYQVAFPVAEFLRLVPWLMLNRQGLSVLVHPLTGNDYADHALYALWLGPALPLDLEGLRDEIP